MSSRSPFSDPAAHAARATHPDRPRVPELPEPVSYRLKKRLLGPPLHSNELDEQRLGKPTALAVFSSDCISSSAYATEEILHILIPVVGLYAFSLVVPITVAILVMLTFLILSYRQTIRAYPAAGGAYMVTRDNFGYRSALVAGLSLLTGYILTVAVSASAGIAALTSVFPALNPDKVVLTLGVVALIAYLNLRGTRESGRIFMVPTYLFMIAMALMIGIGLVRGEIGSGLEHVTLHGGTVGDLIANPHGTSGVADTLMKGAGLWAILGAFASGSSALTGVEAISNGVSAFRPPEYRNARRTLVLMGVTLGVCFLGLGFLSTLVHPVPYEAGSPTVISQVGKVVFGAGPAGHVLFFFLQAATLLVLVLGANTSFADFPRLASFAATDSYMPRQLMQRGHRLVFSNGILLLAICAGVLIIASGASVNKLIPFYGIGVFTSFTMSQSGMAKHHLTHRERHWQVGLVINGFGCAMTAVVTSIFLYKFFAQGAWLLVVLVPVLVAVLVRMNRQYVEEEAELEEEAVELASRRILPKLTVLVMVGDLNRATARALQYGRSLQPSEIRAVHVAVDAQRARALSDEWTTLGLGRVPLQVVACPDRRIANTVLEIAAAEVDKGDREVTILLPRNEYRRLWHRILHDRTSSAIARAVDALPRVNVTFVPYHLEAGRRSGRSTVADVIVVTDSAAPRSTASIGGRRDGAAMGSSASDVPRRPGSPDRRESIGSVAFRDRVVLEGEVAYLTVQPWSGVATLEVVLADATGEISVVFLGRRSIAGIEPGTRLVVDGMVGSHHGHLAMLNPRYRILGSTHTERNPGATRRPGIS